MDVNNYNHIRNTEFYRFLRDQLGLSRETAIRIGLFFGTIFTGIRNFCIALFVIAVAGFVIYAAIAFFDEARDWNQRMVDRQQEQREQRQLLSPEIFRHHPGIKARLSLKATANVQSNIVRCFPMPVKILGTTRVFNLQW